MIAYPSRFRRRAGVSPALTNMTAAIAPILPESKSLPFPPLRVSLPPLPRRGSAPPVPVRVLSPAFPVIVLPPVLSSLRSVFGFGSMLLGDQRRGVVPAPSGMLPVSPESVEVSLSAVRVSPAVSPGKVVPASSVRVSPTVSPGRVVPASSVMVWG